MKCYYCQSEISEKASYCPRCGKNLFSKKHPALTLVLGGFGAIAVGVWIPVFGWFLLIPVGIGMIIVGLIYGFVRFCIRIAK